MHYAIQHQLQSFEFLTTTPRKKVLKHSLIRVESGLVLLRLGKKEYAVEPGQSIWIPFDCLSSLSFFPQSVTQRIDFSCRLKALFPQNAGYVTESELSRAIFKRLADKKIEQAQLEHLLQVLKHEILAYDPKLTLSALSEHITNWSPSQQGPIPKPFQLVLKVREARKRLLSGANQQSVINDLFDGNKDDFTTLNTLILGTN
ncbi:AraC family transcriptional regulator [Vibrio sp. S4M6]|uniref:AraC family transcriptional regulator n=1 Tax=Vibrio sinus TaxID=2946865 RepID=UPI00202AA2BC|nr:AraC family transcriptional regulator [Vibrio sinus]MCL9780616.1 AraC family transcriptional regulator [Vibrio sinus]